MVNFLSLQINAGNKTFYEEIDRLEASHILYLNMGAPHISSYSHVSSSNKRLNQRPLTAFTKKFEDAIYRSFIDTKKTGLMLSGGLDSSAIAIGMKNLGIKGVETFSANYKHLPQKHLPLTDETNYQAAVKNATGYNHNFVSLENISPLESLEKQANYFDEPIHIPNLYLFEKIGAQAKSKNIGIIFDGNDGDTVVSHGFERFEELLRSLNIIGFLYELYRYAIFNQVKLKQFIKSIGHNILLKWGVRKKTKKNSSIVEDSVLFDPKFHNNYSQTAVDSHLDKLKSPLHALAFEYRYLIFKYYDIEIRSPFYDLELINLCVSLPSRWKLRHGRSRYILRSYLKGKVPDLVSQRRHKANLLHGIINNIGENDINKIKKELENIHPLLKNIVNNERISESISRLNGKNEITDFEVTSLLGFFSANRWLRNNKKIH
jgi:asparagine synthase (glutamine-hydrolysing)